MWSPLATSYVQNSRSGCKYTFSFWTLTETAGQLQKIMHLVYANTRHLNAVNEHFSRRQLNDSQHNNNAVESSLSISKINNTGHLRLRKPHFAFGRQIRCDWKHVHVLQTPYAELNSKSQKNDYTRTKLLRVEDFRAQICPSVNDSGQGLNSNLSDYVNQLIILTIALVNLYT